jgi:hypothetical protein
MRNGQRGAKRQPDGIASGSGGAPSMVVSRRVPGQVPVDPRHCVYQSPGIGMARIGEHLLGRPLLHNLAGIHHDHALAHIRDHAERVADENDRRTEIAVELHDQVENLRLDGDVERGGRLVGDQQRGLVGEPHGEHDALAHAAGKLVRIGIDRALRRRNPHAAEQ